MTSMRKLRRRVLTWGRYEQKIYGRRTLAVGIGALRALAALDREQDRRAVDLGYDDEPWGVGCPCGGGCWDDMYEKPLPHVVDELGFAKAGLL